MIVPYGGNEPNFFYTSILFEHFFIGVSFMLVIGLIEIFAMGHEPHIPFSKRYGKPAFWLIVIFWFVFEIATSQGFRSPMVGAYTEVARSIYEAPAAIAGFYLTSYIMSALYYLRKKAVPDARNLLDQHIPTSGEVLEGQISQRGAKDYARDAVTTVTHYTEQQEEKRRHEGKDAIDWLDKNFEERNRGEK